MKLKLKEAVIFGMLGAVMYASKVMLEFLPNVHLIGVFIVAITVTYRKKALYPIYVFIFLTGLLNGFGMWWIPYLYIWSILWGAVMLLPKSLPPKAAPLIYAVVCSLHGFLFGTLYAPAQAIMFGLSFKGMIAWIAAGLPYDAIHGVSNFICGLILIVPVIRILTSAEKTAKKT